MCLYVGVVVGVGVLGRKRELSSYVVSAWMSERERDFVCLCFMKIRSKAFIFHISLYFIQQVNVLPSSFPPTPLPLCVGGLTCVKSLFSWSLRLCYISSNALLLQGVCSWMLSKVARIGLLELISKLMRLGVLYWIVVVQSKSQSELNRKVN